MEASSHKRATPSTRRLRDAVRAALRDGCSTQATKPKKKIAKKKSVLKPLATPAPTIKGCIVTESGRMLDSATGQVRGRVSIVGTRPVERMFESSIYPSRYGAELGAVIDIKDLDLDLDGKPTLRDLADYLRPGKKLHVGQSIFQETRIDSLADKDGVKWLGWNVQNKRPGAENKWVFVAVEKVEK